jgi:membrane protein implicated in regulation of membrane protease activity
MVYDGPLIGLIWHFFGGEILMMNMTFASPVFWFVLGVVFLILEVLTGGFWMLFLGIGALITAGIHGLGIIGGINQGTLTFLITSFLSLFIIRPYLMKRIHKGVSKAIGDPAGQMVVVTQEIPADGPGRVAFQGSTWDALSESGEMIPVDAKVKIVRQDGIRLFVKK